MIRIIAALSLVLGLIVICALLLKFLHNKWQYNNLKFRKISDFLNLNTDSPINYNFSTVNQQYRILTIQDASCTYKILCGPNNTILLDKNFNCASAKKDCGTNLDIIHTGPIDSNDFINNDLGRMHG